jgi:hypothetical protein
MAGTKLHRAYVTILWVEEKQMHMLCKPETLMTLNRDRKVSAALKGLPHNIPCRHKVGVDV